ncbi:hypothetical protein WICPIJ_004321 [Wickerhamomyces pijperi]|uniref:MHD domain-containing protein n=1 Tax=Wickerhamomyces pijperi TaxID=599730 RepID=A0A9P8Q617_WICPI|nr:hypothetical protein WICPIJ_004321 [Wickerhamomyces pijperi]
MINAFFIFSQRGDLLVSEIFKEGVKRNIADIFRIQVILNTENKSPVLTLGSTTFLHIRHNDVYLVVVTRSNSDAAGVLEFLYGFKGLLDQYFQGLVSEELIKLHFLMIYDLLEEVVQLGVPQSVNFNQLKQIIPPPEISKSLFNRSNNGSSGISGSGNTTNNTGFLGFRRSSKDQIGTDVPWRSNGIKYKKNEIYLEVMESLNVLISPNGTVLRSFINGEIEMVSKLSGMPQCFMKLHEMNQLQDFQFHKCVELEKFDMEKVIHFIPPDGEFKILNYKSSNDIKLPFNVKVEFTAGTGSGAGRKSVEYKITLKSLYDKKSTATDFLLKIPVSFLQMNDFKYQTTSGDLKYNKTTSSFEWKISKIQGLIENTLSLQIQPETATLNTRSATAANTVRPPISIANFEILSNPSTLRMNYLDVSGESYRPTKWIRYITKVDSYEIRY